MSRRNPRPPGEENLSAHRARSNASVKHCQEPPMPVAAVIAAARAFLGDRITTNAALREQHSHGEDTQPPVLPDAVAFIETSEEAARLLALCYAQRVPVVA